MKAIGPYDHLISARWCPVARAHPCTVFHRVRLSRFAATPSDSPASINVGDMLGLSLPDEAVLLSDGYPACTGYAKQSLHESCEHDL